MFRQMDLKGKVKDDTQLQTVHQNTISTVRVYEGAGGAVRKFSSTSLPPLFNLLRVMIASGKTDQLGLLQRAALTAGWSSGRLE